MKLFEPPIMIIALAIVLIIFGPKQLPELGKTIGQTIRAFRSSMDSSDPEEAPGSAKATETADAPTSE